MQTTAVSKQVDYSLYLVTDSKLTGEKTILQVVEEALQGGVTLVQYREKRNCSTRAMVQLGMELLQLTHSYRVPLLINDRLDIALAIDADGVHVGQDDMPAPLVRKLLGPEKIVGVSAGNEEEARLAEQQGADYIGVGAIFKTFSKSDAGEPIGLAALKKIAAGVAIPVVAIGGINEQNAIQCIQNGAKGVAVISAIVSAMDPKQAAKNLQACLVHHSNENRKHFF
eukprot:jgi/Galph1/3154/GphlegSOOS_G1770.1